MATKPDTTAGKAVSTLQTVGVLLTPAWIILAVVLYGLASGEVRL